AFDITDDELDKKIKESLNLTKEKEQAEREKAEKELLEKEKIAGDEVEDERKVEAEGNSTVDSDPFINSGRSLKISDGLQDESDF
ncbi:MAG: hypothetical protein MHPSP_001074, partial [Paramarteilia canceri]